MHRLSATPDTGTTNAMNQESTNDQGAVAEQDDEIVVRNAEQQHMIDTLVLLRQTCNAAIDAIEVEDNESLFGQPVDWDSFTCLKAERWLDSEGALGWRVYCDGVSPNATKLLTCLRDKLVGAGWDGIEIVPAC